MSELHIRSTELLSNSTDVWKCLYKQYKMVYIVQAELGINMKLNKTNSIQFNGLFELNWLWSFHVKPIHTINSAVTKFSVY